MDILVLILAAGKGTRMRSSLPKVLQPLAGRPMIFHLLDAVGALSEMLEEAEQRVLPAIIEGFSGEQLRAVVNQAYPDMAWVVQSEQLGTGHAVMQALPLIEDSDITLILLGDAPLVYPDTLRALCQSAEKNGFALLTTIMEEPFGYGRIVRDEHNHLLAIVEEKDASAMQKLITEVNTGMMAIRSARLKTYLSQLDNCNAQQEYYLTDLIGLMAKDGLMMETVLTEDLSESLGVNNRAQLAEAEAVLRYRQAQMLLHAGVTLIDPQRIDVQGTVEVGEDCVIEPNVFLAGSVVLGNGVRIESGCRLSNCVIGDEVVIHSHSVIDGAVIEQGAEIGPFARLRAHSHLARGAKVGNFVELKNAKIREFSKINHLSYIGDCEMGSYCNIGAGTITCNYDGANKWQTVIGDNVFVGSNSALIAPVTLGDGATVGAGSVISKAVLPEQLAVTRAAMKTKDHYQRAKKK